jgi:hypothetical protein
MNPNDRRHRTRAVRRQIEVQTLLAVGSQVGEVGLHHDARQNNRIRCASGNRD